jgi:DNA-binding IclR family transcriptional regulator
MSLAVKRSLKILEIAALSGAPLSFSQINAELGNLSNASLSRLLSELISEGYLFKNTSGLYECGERMGVFAAVKNKDVGEVLISRYGQLIEEMTNIYDATGIILENVAGIPTTIHKTQTESSVNMAQIGSAHPRIEDLWMRIIAAYLPRFRKKFPASQRDSLDKIMDDGYCFEFCKIRPHFVRLGFPLFDERGEKLLGILGLGGTPLQLNHENMNEIVERIKEAL